MGAGNYSTGFSISSELSGRLENKGRSNERIFALERFHDAKDGIIKHGLGIATDIGDVDYAQSLNEGRTTTTTSHKELFDSNCIMLLGLREFMHSKEFKQEFKESVISRLSRHSAGLGKLDYLHMALASVNILIIESGLEIEGTLRIDRRIFGNCYNHLIILLGSHSHARILIKTLDESCEHSISTDFTDIIALEDSHLELIEQRSLSKLTRIYGRKELVLKRRAKAKWISIDTNPRLAVIYNNALLEGEDSSIMLGSMTSGECSEYVVYNTAEHIGKRTGSIIKTNSALRKSKVVVRGMIKIGADASGSSGFERSEMLMLDKDSRGISIPDLEIHNDDVRCSHSSAITRLDEDKLLYIESRGITRDGASCMMIDGFYDKILKEISDEDLIEEIKGMMTR